MDCSSGSRSMGKRMWDDGNGLKGIYSGQLNRDGRPDGEGLLTSKDGRITYEGIFRDGNLVHGTTVEDGIETYDGEWSEGKYHGYGVLTFDMGGSEYEGQFRCGLKYGYGHETTADEEVPPLFGIWKRGMLKTHMPKGEVVSFIERLSISVAKKYSQRAADDDAGLFQVLATKYSMPQAAGRLDRVSQAMQSGYAADQVRSPARPRVSQAMEQIGDRTNSSPKIGAGYPVLPKKAKSPSGRRTMSDSTASTESGVSTASDKNPSLSTSF